MADNITAPASGTNFATDEIGGIHYPRNKIGFGADGAYADVSADNPFPVAMINGGNGTIGGATETTLASLSGKLPASLGPKAASTSLSIVPATGADLATGAGLTAIVSAITGATYFPATQPVSGNVGVTGSVAVTGQFYQATQPVSIAAPVAVTGTFFQATQPISAAALPLPAGAATAAKQDAIAALLAPYTTVTALTVGGAAVAAGRAFRIVATAAGNVTVTLSGGGSLVIPVNVGLTELPYAVTAVTASTATATYGNLN